MKRFFDPCRSYRQDLALLAAGALPDADRTSIENHLADCGDCRKRLAEFQRTATSLTRWAHSLPACEPNQGAKSDWAKAIHTAASTKTAPAEVASSAYASWWQGVIWSSRRVWIGLAAVWVFIFAGHEALQDHSGPQVKSSPPTHEMIMAFREQQNLLNELLADRTPPPVAERPKFAPKPRSQTMEVRVV